MCGIYGRIGRRDDELDRRSLASLAHRGPDDSGLYVDQRGLGSQTLVLGHVRLSILDLSSAGHQPMVSPTGDLVVSFNGEIYNYPTLKKDLEDQGHVFRSSSDTEVLLHLYERYGDGMLEKLEGMYAFGQHRSKKRSLRKDLPDCYIKLVGQD